MSDGYGALATKQYDGASGAMTQEYPGVDPKHAYYDPSHHNTLHHAGKASSKAPHNLAL